MQELFNVMLSSFWSFIGSWLLIAVAGHYFVYLPFHYACRLRAIKSLEKLKAKQEIAVLAGLEYGKDKE